MDERERVAKDLLDDFAAAMDKEADGEEPLACGVENPEPCDTCN